MQLKQKTRLLLGSRKCFASSWLVGVCSSSFARCTNAFWIQKANSTSTLTPRPSRVNGSNPTCCSLPSETVPIVALDSHSTPQPLASKRCIEGELLAWRCELCSEVCTKRFTIPSPTRTFTIARRLTRVNGTSPSCCGRTICFHLVLSPAAALMLLPTRSKQQQLLGSRSCIDRERLGSSSWTSHVGISRRSSTRTSRPGTSSTTAHSRRSGRPRDMLSSQTTLGLRHELQTDFGSHVLYIVFGLGHILFLYLFVLRSSRPQICSRSRSHITEKLLDPPPHARSCSRPTQVAWSTPGLVPGVDAVVEGWSRRLVSEPVRTATDKVVVGQFVDGARGGERVFLIVNDFVGRGTDSGGVNGVDAGEDLGRGQSAAVG